jgi:hypothetical protein
LVAAAVLAAASGCTPGGSKTDGAPKVPQATKASYTLEEVKAAFYTAADAGPGMVDFWYEQDFHDHNNYVPPGEIQVCPLAQRSNAPGAPPNTAEMTGAQAVGQFAVKPGNPNDTRVPSLIQNAFVFATAAIADAAMDQINAEHAKCPASFSVPGGPPPILGDYNLSSRPFELGGWKGYLQQVAHTFPEGVDDVYFEDMAVLVLKRANVVLYLDLTHRIIVGERSDAPERARAAVATVLQRLG